MPFLGLTLIEELQSQIASINPDDGGESNEINFVARNRGAVFEAAITEPLVMTAQFLRMGTMKPARCDAEHAKAHSISSETAQQDFTWLVVHGAMMLGIRTV